MFSLSKHTVTLSHLNLRAEMRGDVDVTMVDLKLTFEAGNLLLDELGPHLRTSLYHGDGHADLLGVDPDRTPHLRFPLLGPLRWNANYWGNLTMHLDSRKKDDVVFGDVKLNKLVVDPKEGGTVAIAMHAQFEPTEEQIAKLAMLLHHEIRMSMVALEVEQELPREPAPGNPEAPADADEDVREEALS